MPAPVRHFTLDAARERVRERSLRTSDDLDDNLDRLAEKFGLAARPMAEKLAATG